jgi:hypothetical protein
MCHSREDNCIGPYFDYSSYIYKKLNKQYSEERRFFECMIFYFLICKKELIITNLIEIFNLDINDGFTTIYKFNVYVHHLNQLSRFYKFVINRDLSISIKIDTNSSSSDDCLDFKINEKIELEEHISLFNIHPTIIINTANKIYNDLKQLNDGCKVYIKTIDINITLNRIKD